MRLRVFGADLPLLLFAKPEQAGGASMERYGPQPAQKLSLLLSMYGRRIVVGYP